MYVAVGYQDHYTVNAVAVAWLQHLTELLQTCLPSAPGPQHISDSSTAPINKWSQQPTNRCDTGMPITAEKR